MKSQINEYNLVADLKLDEKVKEIDTFQKDIVAAILEMGKMAKDPKHGFDWYDYFCYAQNVMPALVTASEEKKKILEANGLRVNLKRDLNKIKKECG